MANELRLVFFIIGALVLIALLVHGVWTVRKNNGQPKHRYYDETAQPDEPVTSKAEGFDELGIGEVRVVKQGSARNTDRATNRSNFTKTAASEPNKSAPNVTASVAKPAAAPVATRAEQQGELAFDEKAEPELNFNALMDDDLDTAGIDTPKIEAEQVNTVAKRAESSVSSNQETTSTAAEPSEVLILYVLLPENKEIKGDDLLSALLTLGFKYGDMDIFHRHTDSSGSGEVLFSLANMFNPGTFDLDNMKQLQTRGLSLFMTLPGPGDALQNFNLMHNAAKKLASEFSGQVLDGQRSVLTVQTVRHYVDKIREFQRQKLIHG
ncbi:cell division protein ZipA [Rheinheimera sp. WS51]|uniref:cell division protein ZipA n=1 Tax=Rheinheimera sp. WS51 TaxID=3425886 RepID=UPI003D8E739E